MPEAPRSRPEGSELLVSFSGHIAARPKAVFDALDSRLRPGEHAQSLYLADPAAFLVVAQGGWWYRGEYRVVPDESGSNLEHRLYNVAQTAHRVGGFTARRVVSAAPAEFQRLLKELRLDLE
jgi:hypothetical protein